MLLQATAEARTLNRVRAILTHRVEDVITEREAIDEMIAEMEAAGFDVVGPAAPGAARHS